ncbi:hypothetical protein FB451DRAFT_1380290 [Mycena latifolia]|nr:hypothetical protein FB451DRAFT_1380290 [Mycena latifolia]
MSAPHLPLPAPSAGARTDRRTSFKIEGIPVSLALTISPPTRMNSPTNEKGGAALKTSRSLRSPVPGEPQKIILACSDKAFLLPASMPPEYHLFDLFPFSLLVKCLTKRAREVKGKNAARMRAKMLMEKNGHGVGSHNLPLEISLYLHRKQTDVPTTNTLLASLNQLVDALTGLERILTTPNPFSFPPPFLSGALPRCGLPVHKAAFEGRDVGNYAVGYGHPGRQWQRPQQQLHVASPFPRSRPTLDVVSPTWIPDSMYVHAPSNRDTGYSV